MRTWPRAVGPGPTCPSVMRSRGAAKLRRRLALLTTDNERAAIAAAAIIGLSSTPMAGYRIPAAMGMPNAL